MLVHERCVAIIARTLLHQEAHKLDPHHYEPADSDFLVVALDLLSAAAEGCGEAVESLIGEHNIMELLYRCGQVDVPEVRQSAFALLGDYARVCFMHVEPRYDNFIAQLARNLDPRFTPVCNNAAWAIGEISVNVGVCPSRCLLGFPAVLPATSPLLVVRRLIAPVFPMSRPNPNFFHRSARRDLRGMLLTTSAESARRRRLDGSR